MPDRPWQRIAADPCGIKGATFLDVDLVDYYSRFTEMTRLRSETKTGFLINHVKSIMARHGIPKVLVFHNCPNF